MCTDKQFGPLLNKLSPVAMHRLMNLLRKELGIDLSESAVSAKAGENNGEMKK